MSTGQGGPDPSADQGAGRHGQAREGHRDDREGDGEEGEEGEGQQGQGGETHQQGRYLCLPCSVVSSVVCTVRSVFYARFLAVPFNKQISVTLCLGPS